MISYKIVFRAIFRGQRAGHVKIPGTVVDHSMTEDDSHDTDLHIMTDS